MMQHSQATEHILDIIDQVRASLSGLQESQRAFYEELLAPLPQFVACGPQSAGKSSAVRRVCGISLPEASTPGQTAGSIAAEFDRVARSKETALSNPSAKSARLSRRILVLFSGPYSRPDGLIAFLLRLGLQVTAIDNDGAKGGNNAHDLLNNAVYENILRRAQRGD